MGAAPGCPCCSGSRPSGVSAILPFMTATNDPAPASPDEPAKAQFGPHRFYISVVMDEEIEHYRFAVRDLAVLEAR